MPDAAAETTAAVSEKKPPPSVNPDRVGEELADDATIWPIFDRLAREDDERRTKAWDTGLNNLALFAGLFSAVTTAFIIEAQKDIEPDYAQLTFLALNATAFGEKPVNQPFVVPSSARTVTCLWVASLILSLSAALIAIMGKDWIGMYTARPVCNLRQWAEMRSYRLRCVERWYMSGVIAAAPVLLHVSLLLFGAGLVLFISSDPLTHHLTLGLSLAAGVLYLVTTLSAVVFSASPYKSPATQMIRATVSTFYSYVCSVVYRPKRKPLRTLVCEIHATFLRRGDGTTFLPGGQSENTHRYADLWPGIVKACGTAIAYMRRMPTCVYTAPGNLQWSSVQSWLHSTASAARHLSSDWFLSSMWTDLPSDRRPELLAEALSWLIDASQAPDVFHAVVFALGDLDVGPEVGKHTSLALRTRLRAEIRRTWQQVDFQTLSRYVLSDRNTPGEPVLGYHQLIDRFDIAKAPELRCEEGLAAVIIVDPGDILSHDVAEYCPDQVQQPRMLDLLMPHMEKPQDYLTDVLILLSNRYRAHLWTIGSFSLRNLEAHLYESLDTETRDAYATAVTVKYGGTAGPIELLTFLCCHRVIGDVTRQAAVELVMELLERLPDCEHRCLAYLFGSRDLWNATWKDKHWSPNSLAGLSRSLETSCYHPHEPSSVRTLSDNREFNLALARTAAMRLSPQHMASAWDAAWIEFLHGHLCQSPLPSHPDGDEKFDVISLILENAALVDIMGMTFYYGFDYDVDVCRTAILAMIISHVAHRLCDPATIRDGLQLFAALARTEGKRLDGETCIWDLGEWLRTTAPENLQRSLSYTAAMRDIYNALSTIYPRCEHNPELRAIWDRIGYYGPPPKIAYLCDPYLDIGELFARAEDPLSQSGV